MIIIIKYINYINTLKINIKYKNMKKFQKREVVK